MTRSTAAPLRRPGLRAGLLAIAAATALSSVAFAEERCPGPGWKADVLPSPASLEGSTPHVFKSADGGDLRLHVFQPPKGKAPAKGRPTVIMFYGGGWLGGTVDQLVPQAAYVASRGAVAILADYRTYCRNGADVNDEVNDAKDAVRWVRHHARELGVDPKRIAAMGASSGGHLASSVAVFADTDSSGVSSRPDLLLLYYPCTDLTNEVEKSSAKALRDYGKDLSPLYHLRAGLPPTFVFEGTEDKLYPENKQYCDESRAKGDVCHWTEYQGARHGFFYAQANPPTGFYEMGLRAMDDALVAEGYLPKS